MKPFVEADNATVVIDAIRERLDRCDRPIVVAIDGRSGAGKSLLAARLGSALPAVVVPEDDFYAAHISDGEWNAKTPARRVTDVVDWQHLPPAVREPLRAGRAASWFPFDFDAGRRPDGTFRTSTVAVGRQPAPVVIRCGAYSSRPELANVIDLTLLVDLQHGERYRRQVARDGAQYVDDCRAAGRLRRITTSIAVRPPSAFDLVAYM